MFTTEKQALRTSYPRWIPVHDIFWLVFYFLDAEVFEGCFLRCIQAVSEVTKGKVTSIDSKKLWHSYEKGSSKAATTCEYLDIHESTHTRTAQSG